MQQDDDSDFVRAVGAQFADGGALTHATEGYVSRPGQIAFACEVARAIERRGTLVAEAGTGTGKTFAYLTPALLSQQRTIVSTAGKSLQDQLFDKDIPALENALGLHIDAALLKGRSNYLCKHRLRQMQEPGAILSSPQAVQDLAVVSHFAQLTRDGDRTCVQGVAEDSPVWPAVTSTKDNCLGAKCDFYGDCFVMRARARARQADLVVVNHHLYLSAMADMDEDVPDEARLLPAADVVIFDEAHKLPEIASNFFGTELSTYAIREVVREVRAILLAKFKSYAQDGGAQWEVLTSAINNALSRLLLDVDMLGLLEGDNLNIMEIKDLANLTDALKHLASSIEALIDAIEPLMEMNDDLAQHREVLYAQHSELERWVYIVAAPDKVDSSDAPMVRWIARTRAEAQLHETPLLIAQYFGNMREQQSSSAWIFTSATIATEGNNFSHFVEEMGLQQAQTCAWPSPFDYASQAMLYVPERMPSPKSCERAHYIACLMAESWPVIDLLAGRTFVLCTSYEAMQTACETLQSYIEENERDYTVLVQGEDSRAHILQKFRRTPHAILIATMSFWEGIDIKGEQLSLVIIDKLPFAPQNDPVLAARCRWLQQQGINPFTAYQVPLAAIALKQGAGRLIRSETDRGILIVGDERLIPGVTGYGVRLLKSLPAYVRTRKLERVMNFWRFPDQAS